MRLRESVLLSTSAVGGVGEATSVLSYNEALDWQTLSIMIASPSGIVYNTISIAAEAAISYPCVQFF